MPFCHFVLRLRMVNGLSTDDPLSGSLRSAGQCVHCKVPRTERVNFTQVDQGIWQALHEYGGALRSSGKGGTWPRLKWSIRAARINAGGTPMQERHVTPCPASCLKQPRSGVLRVRHGRQRKGELLLKAAGGLDSVGSTWILEVKI